MIEKVNSITQNPLKAAHDMEEHTLAEEMDAKRKYEKTGVMEQKKAAMMET